MNGDQNGERKAWLEEAGLALDRALVAANALCTELMSKAKGRASASPSPAGHSIGAAQMVSQNSRRRSTRSARASRR